MGMGWDECRNEGWSLLHECFLSRKAGQGASSGKLGEYEAVATDVTSYSYNASIRTPILLSCLKNCEG